MPLVSLAEARLHMRAGSSVTEDSLITMWLSAAERQVIEYLNREVYATQDLLNAAIAAAPAALETAQAVYEAALESYESVEDLEERARKIGAARVVWEEAQRAFSMKMNGMVTNDNIKVAILLTTAHLFEYRSPEYSMHLEKQMPTQFQHFVHMHRIGRGV